MFDVYKKLFKYVPEKKAYVYLAILLSLISTFFYAGAYLCLFKLLEEVIILSNLSNGLVLAIKVAVLLVAGALLYFLSLCASHVFGFRLETNLRKHGIEGLTKASFKFFDLNESGKIRKVIDDNASLTHNTVAHLIPDLAGAILMPIFVLILGFLVSVRVGITMVVLIIGGLILMGFMNGEKSFLEHYNVALEKLSSETVEYVRGMQIVKIFGIDVREFKTLNKAIKDYSKYALDYSYSCKKAYVLFQSFFFGFILIALPIFILIYGITNVRVLAVEFIMVFLLSGMFYVYIMRIMYTTMYIFQASDAVKRLENLYDSMNEDKIDFGTVSEMKSSDIEFKNVSFGYNDKLILENLSFKLEAGKSYALVGSSGSGKSTISKLISGFYKVNSGDILIGGTSISNFKEETLIKNIALVFQSPKLFKKTIYENVLYAKPSASYNEVMEALHLAGCDSILAKFKDKENTLIGTKGVYLSGGEKQRIAIARAILKDAKIVIFDEASAAVDPENEHELQKAFANLMKDRTIIMIAHRLSSIRQVDEIIVLEEGKIVERGSDEALMKQNGVYKHFQDMYTSANDWRIVE